MWHCRVDKARAAMLLVWYQALARRIHQLRRRRQMVDALRLTHPGGTMITAFFVLER